MTGSIPEERITPSKPFTHTGIDYAGPFQVRIKSTSKNTDKVYLALLVCLATMAIHLSKVAAFSNSISHVAAELGTQWNMIPPRAPLFGGLWEAGVKAAKKHLKKIMGTTVLTFDEFNLSLRKSKQFSIRDQYRP